MVKQKQLVALTFLILCLATSVVSVAFAGKPQNVNGELIEIAGMIDGANAFDHVAELSRRYYEGRLAGTPRCDEAAEYIASKFNEYGLDPFGDYGTYFETFKITYWLSPDWYLDILTPAPIAGRYDSYPMEYCASGDITAELVYVGLGAPTDYVGKDVTGKIAFVLRGAYYFRDKVAWAYDQGAAGVIIFDHTYEPLFSGTLVTPQNIPAVSITRADGEKILRAMGFTVTADDYLDPTNIFGTQSVFPTAHMYVDTILERDKPTKNVLGIIPGRSKPNEYVVIGGHYDHMGIMKKEVYNGANDNAAGVAVVLELARVLSIYAVKHPPTRSIIFAAWTAEEEGLYGSDYFVKTHQKMLPQIDIMLNLDMPGAGEWVKGEPRNNMYIEDTAHQYTDGDQPVYTSSGKEWAPKLVYDVAQLLIREKKIVLGADYTEPYYETREYALYSGVDDVKVVEYIGRSDHEPFLLAGVPATAIFSSADKYPEYHQPGDDVGLVDPAKLEISGILVGCSAWKVAQYTTQPAVSAEPTVYPAIGARHIIVLPAGEVA